MDSAEKERPVSSRSFASTARVSQAEKCHLSGGDPLWVRKAVQELVVLLRDDYAALMAVLSALADAGLTY